MHKIILAKPVQPSSEYDVQAYGYEQSDTLAYYGPWYDAPYGSKCGSPWYPDPKQESSFGFDVNEDGDKQDWFPDTGLDPEDPWFGYHILITC